MHHAADAHDSFDPKALAAHFKSAVTSIAALLLVLALIVFL